MQIPVGRPKDLEKRQRILSVAKALFLAHGYHASSMNQIAREAGVTKLTVYNHFQDKATLFSCAIEDTCEAILHEHPQLLQPSSDFAQEFYQLSARFKYYSFTRSDQAGPATDGTGIAAKSSGRTVLSGLA